MSLLRELVSKPGVSVAIDFSYHGDRFEHEGDLSHEQARQASVMARAHNMGVHMQAAMLQDTAPVHGFAPLRGWQVRGPVYTVCGMANVVCFVEHRAGKVDEVMALLRERLADAPSDMVY